MFAISYTIFLFVCYNLPLFLPSFSCNTISGFFVLCRLQMGMYGSKEASYKDCIVNAEDK